MKFLLLFGCLLLVPLPVRSQSTAPAVLRIDSLPSGGVVLQRGWKWRAGDTAQGASPQLDDQTWTPINPASDIHDLPQVRQAQMGWFRLHLRVADSLIHKPLTLVIQQAGASEIYLDGQLLYRFGRVSADPRLEQTYNPKGHPYGLHLEDKPEHVLAVRYSFTRSNFYHNLAKRGNPCLQLTFKPTGPAFNDFQTTRFFSAVQNYVQVACFLVIGLTTLFLFRAFRSQRAFLYFGIYFAAQAVQNTFQILASVASSTSTSDLFWLLSHVTTALGAMSNLTGFYALYRQRLRWFYYGIWVYALLTTPLLLLWYNWGWLPRFCFYLILYIDAIRLNLQAARARRPGAWLLFFTLLNFYIFFTVFLLATFDGNLRLASFSNTVALFTLPIGFSLFFAGEFARTGRSLQDRVVEVEELSQKNLAHEQEKQQILAQQNENLERQVAERTAQLQQSLNNLKATQNQLVQSEKMASLGELTAGIAHEIKNPLNFVNNFSKITIELANELQEEQATKQESGLEQELLLDIKQNLEKIAHHGQRADSIVKGMLEHSRVSTGEKRPTNLNALADEYLRLAYHGLQAKDKSFNAGLVTNFDTHLGDVILNGQDMGRVLLNLYNNAFYAVRQKQQQIGNGYRPTIEVTTRRKDAQVEIRVIDNGTGIPEAVRQKIFQPFFTTKPTGQGTGLGLSLSYDIVTKSHGGIMEVESQEGEGTAIIVLLPTPA